MIVTVIDREAMEKTWKNPGSIIVITRTIQISDYCPVCGEERGKPKLRNFTEAGHPYTIHVWTNLCGHVDMYKDVIKEFENRNQQSRPIECTIYDESDYYPNITEHVAEKMTKDFRKRLNKDMKFRS